MSTNSIFAPKRLIFDSVFFTYSFFIVLYIAFQTAGLFGVQISAINQDDLIRQMGLIAWCSFALTVLFAAICLALSRFHVATLGDVLFASPKRKLELGQQYPFLRSFWGWHLIVIFVLTFIVSMQMTEFSIYELMDEDGFGGAVRLWDGLTHANLALLPTAIMEVIETIFIAFLATVISVPIAFVLAFFCAKNIMTHPLAFVVFIALRTIMNISRSVEPLIWAVIFTVWVGVGPFAGMLALAIHSISSLAKQYAEIVEDVSTGPIEGIRSTGANMVQTIWFAVVPQVILPYIAFTIFRWDINVRMATVIGLVGGGGIGTLLIKYQGQAMWPEVGCIIIVIAAVVWVMDVASAYIREALR